MTKLNKENIDKVIEVIRDENKYFDMGEYSVKAKQSKDESYLAGYETFDLSKSKYYSCGTASCICGWANQIRITEKGKSMSNNIEELHSVRFAADWLGLNFRDSDELFHAYSAVDYLINFQDITKEEAMNSLTRGNAIAVLENLKETGIVDWSIAS